MASNIYSQIIMRLTSRRELADCLKEDAENFKSQKFGSSSDKHVVEAVKQIND